MESLLNLCSDKGKSTIAWMVFGQLQKKVVMVKTKINKPPPPSISLPKGGGAICGMGEMIAEIPVH